MNKKSTKANRQPMARKGEPVVGLRWVDKFDGAEYEILKITEENISYLFSSRRKGKPSPSKTRWPYGAE